MNGYTIGFPPQTRKTNNACEMTAKEVLFEWLHHRISPTDTKVRIPSQDPIILTLVALAPMKA